MGLGTSFRRRCWSAPRLSASNSCYLYFERSTNRVWLADDAGVGNVSLATLGTAVTLQNSQCVFDAQNSSSSGTGTNLTVNLALSFKPAFAGVKTNFMTAYDGTNSSPWEAVGSWTVPGNQPPTNVSITPSSGSGSGQTFSYLFSDPNGFGNIVSAQMLVGATLSASNSCYLYFERSTNRVWLADDAGVGNVSLATLGTAVTLQNSQCVFDAGASSSSGTDTNLTVNLALSFKSAFAGAKTNFMTAFDGTNVSPWQAMGTWTVPAACTYSISPTSQSFTSAAGTSTVAVTAGAGCSWTTVSNAAWITITAGASGTGN